MNSLDIRFISSQVKTKALIILLPCMGGNILAYRYPLTLWQKMGYSIFLFNPPGHGKSGGVFSFEESFSLLKKEISLLKIEPEGLPFIGIGHSGGGSGILNFFSKCPEYEVSRIFLLSPILDTAGSLRFLYKNSNIQEFINSLRIQDSRVSDILSRDRWLDENVWTNEGLRETINGWAAKAGEMYAELGTFLENVFIPSRKFHPYMEQFSQKTVLFLPRDDIWYPAEDSIGTAKRFGIEHKIIPSAENHFFRNGWRDVGKEITSLLAS